MSMKPVWHPPSFPPSRAGSPAAAGMLGTPRPRWRTADDARPDRAAGRIAAGLRPTPGAWRTSACPVKTNRGYEYNIHTHQFSRVLEPGVPHGGSKGPSLTAAAINNHGDVAGFVAVAGGKTDAFLSKAGGQFIKIAYPGAAMTQAFGINDRDEVVGAYTIGTGSKAKMYGFIWQPGHGFTTVSDPKGLGSTVINGVNNAGDLAGFYTGSKGNTGGMLAQPSH